MLAEKGASRDGNFIDIAYHRDTGTPSRISFIVSDADMPRLRCKSAAGLPFEFLERWGPVFGLRRETGFGEAVLRRSFRVTSQSSPQSKAGRELTVVRMQQSIGQVDVWDGQSTFVFRQGSLISFSGRIWPDVMTLKGPPLRMGRGRVQCGVPVGGERPGGGRLLLL